MHLVRIFVLVSLRQRQLLELFHLFRSHSFALGVFLVPLIRQVLTYTAQNSRLLFPRLVWGKAEADRRDGTSA